MTPWGLLIIVWLVAPVSEISIALIATLVGVYLLPINKWVIVACLAGLIEDVVFVQRLGLTSSCLLLTGFFTHVIQWRLGLRSPWLIVIMAGIGEIGRRLAFHTAVTVSHVGLTLLLTWIVLLIFRLQGRDQAVYLKR